MTIHFINGFTCKTFFPYHWECGTIEMLIETNDGLILVDTGLGTDDYMHHSGIINLFRAIMYVPLDPKEAAIKQIVRLGYKPEDVHHIILTHMHFDHCGGLPDFPWAKVHLYRKEFEAFTGRRRQFSDIAYVQRHISHGPDWVFYEDTGEKWFDFNAIRLPFTPEMWLIPLAGHTRGLCGVAIKTPEHWLFQTSDAAAIFNEKVPDWFITMALSRQHSRVKQFAREHPDIQVVGGHAWLNWFMDHKNA